METLLQDLRYGLRSLIRKPGFTIVAVLTLALGIGANAAIFSIVDGVLLRPLPYEDSDRLMLLSERNDFVPTRWISYPNFLDWRDRNRVFESISTTRNWRLTLTGNGDPQSLNARMVSADYFNAMRVKPFLGRDFNRLEENREAAPAAILSYGFWQQNFGGDPEIVGKPMTLDNRSFTIIGVMPRSFNERGGPPLWVLIGQFTGQGNWMQRDVRVAGFVIGRLKSGATIEQARAEMNSISEELIRQYPRTNAGHIVNIVSLYDNFVGDARLKLLILLGAVGMVLLIACANIANLLLSRAATRRKEFAVRAALGAGRGRIVRQLLTESVLLSLIGGAFGLLSASWAVDLLIAAEPGAVPRLSEVGVDSRALLFTFALSLLTGIVFGIAPALHSMKIDLSGALKQSGSKTDARSGRLRNALIVSEVALSMTLLVGAGLLIKSFARIMEDDPGFDPNRVLTMNASLPRLKYSDRDKVNQFYVQLLNGIERIPGVEAVAVANELPGFTGWQTDIAVKGRPPIKPGEELHVDWGIVSAGYFDAMKISLLKGRVFTPTESETGALVLVIDENLAKRFWPDEDPIGKSILYDSPTPHEIIGVVRNVKLQGGETSSRGRIYTPLGRFALDKAKIAIRSSVSDEQQLLIAATREIQALDKNLPVSEAATMNKLLDRQIAMQRLNAVLLALFAAAALTLSAVGIYGVTSCSVAERTREIGIRIALGAQPRDVLKHAVIQGIKPALVGIAVGLAASLALTQLMKSLLYGVSASDPVTFAAIALLLLITAVLACWIPARRATRVDPMIALRYE